MPPLGKVWSELRSGGKMTNDTVTIKGLEQGRANFAYKCAEVAKACKIDKRSKEYKSYVKKIPMLIKTNGLGATFAFVKSKSKEDIEKSGYAYKLIYDHTGQWLRKDDKNLWGLNESDDLVEMIIKLDSPQYRATTNEVLSFFKWLSRFADGLIEGEAENEP